MQIYVVEPGDTIDSIAARFSVTVGEISYVNQIPAPYSLAVGQAVLVQTEDVSADRARYSKGYAYPFISRWVLSQTLPYLSSLLIFSYGFTTDGQIVYPVGDDEWMIAMANDYGVNPVLVLTPIGEDGTFDNNRIHAMLSDIDARDRLIGEITDVVNAKGYRGVDVDFEYILREDRDSFTEFVAVLTQTMNSIGLEVSVCLAPKTSAGQPGLLYEGKDYRGLGEAANEVLLMTYEWGYTYGPPMAVAPLNKVRQVVEYAL
ncbi:MAG: LysM peptidoglycan-binding domain-containing protein, partial [Lachnospiraceae bacterium]|nr:LysM peptidoglycan-binding domain-containing protein [Lachnospiraceae bacterium]